MSDEDSPPLILCCSAVTTCSSNAFIFSVTSSASVDFPEAGMPAIPTRSRASRDILHHYRKKFELAAYTWAKYGYHQRSLFETMNEVFSKVVCDGLHGRQQGPRRERDKAAPCSANSVLLRFLSALLPTSEAQMIRSPQWE